MFKKILNNRFIKKALETNDPPERIARGVALGSFIAVTPTIGFQIYLCLLVALIIKANRLAAVAMTFVLNPLIIIPPSYWYFPAYYLGAYVLGMESVGLERIKDAYRTATGLFDLLGNLWSLGIDVYGPMMLGGLIMGLPLGLVTYHLSLKILKRRVNQAQEIPQEAGLTEEPSPETDADKNQPISDKTENGG